MQGPAAPAVEPACPPEDLLVPVAAINAAGAPLATGITSFLSQNHVYQQIIRVGFNYKFDK